MQIVFRCHQCETINEIPATFQYRLCRICGKIITYLPGESVICDEITGVYEKFLDAKNLSQKLAEEFFKQADLDSNRVHQIANNHEMKEIELLDVPAATVAETVLFIINNNNNTIDELIQNCSTFNISLQKLEKILIQMKKEGMIYQPKGWLINII